MPLGCFRTLGLCHARRYTIANARITELPRRDFSFLRIGQNWRALGDHFGTFLGEFVSSLSGADLIVGLKA
jgi:hypothetical protein